MGSPFVLQLAGATAFAVILSLSSGALAWGDLGHRVICEIAFREVRDGTRQRIKDLIRRDPEFTRFSDSCTWPDHPVSRPTEHYVNLPRDATGIGTDPCPLAHICVVSAIADDLDVLASATTDKDAKLASMKYLGHWVGDVHQPLHVSFEDDRGGSQIIVDGSCGSQLHSAWDVCLVEHTLGIDVMAIAATLRAEITPAQREDWTASKPSDWANESFAIAVTPSLGYCVSTEGACWYDVGNRSLDPGEPLKTVTLGPDYVEAAAPIIRDRFKPAGVRLAHLLDQVFGD